MTSCYDEKWRLKLIFTKLFYNSCLFLFQKVYTDFFPYTNLVHEELRNVHELHAPSLYKIFIFTSDN